MYIKKTKKGGFARSKKYHDRNIEQLKKDLSAKFPNQETDPIVEEMYNLFRERFTFFKK